MNICPCGSNKVFARCCGLYLNQGKKAPPPEVLMRSRYTAFTLVDIKYIEKTMCGPVAEAFNAIETLQFTQNATWKWEKI